MNTSSNGTPEPPSPAPQIQAAPEQSIQIACSSCEGIMEVPASAAGQTTACPYCQQLLEIPTVAPASPAMPAADPLAASAGPWDSLGDIDTGLPNPYESSAAPLPSSNAWSAPKSSKSIRGLTLGNVINLTMECAFPASLSAALVQFVMSIVSGVVFYGTLFAFGQILPSTGMAREDALTVLYVILGILSLVMVALSAFGMAMICNGALDTIRNRKPNSDALFSPGEAFVPMMILQFVIMLGGFLLAAIPVLIQWAVGNNPILMLFIFGIMVLGGILFGMAVCLAPIAVVDGHNPIDAVGVSAKIVTQNIGTMIGLFFIIIIGFVAASAVTCGLGAILFFGVPFYMYAAAYHLATK